MKMQCTDTVLLIRPYSFEFNSETESSNTFQTYLPDLSKDALQIKVISEFEAFAYVLRSNDIRVHIIDDTPLPKKPDAIFPNNWISLHEDGTVIIYPMYATNRRTERRTEIIDYIKKKFNVSSIIDLTENEQQGKYLEGTGSIVFDHLNHIAYACISPRTDKNLFIELCDLLNYKPVYFRAINETGKEIYHTNVMMCITENLAIVCLESIINTDERKLVHDLLHGTGHAIMEISFSQMNQFAGNMLGLKSMEGKHLLVMSQTAFDSLDELQIKKLSQHTELVPISVPTIETIGGGSTRCMMAEIFLQKKDPWSAEA